MLPWLVVLGLQFGSSCVYLRAPVRTPSSCGAKGVGAKEMLRRPKDGRWCEAGLPPGVQVRFLSSGSLCVGAQRYERIQLEGEGMAGRGADLPQWSSVAVLCRGFSGPRPRRSRWWMPTVGFSAEKSLRLSPDGAGFSDATTFWLTLTFPFPSGERSPPPDRRRFDELCEAARRLNRVMAPVGSVRLRARAGLQLLAWRDELEVLTGHAIH